MTAVLSLTERVAGLLGEFAAEPHPDTEAAIERLINGNAAAHEAWDDYRHALDMLDDLAHGGCPLSCLTDDEAQMHPELAEAEATGRWMRAKADAFDAILMAVSVKAPA